MSEMELKAQISRISEEFARQLAEVLTTVSQEVHGRYARPVELAEEYSISESTVSKMKKLILQQTPERYAEDSVIDFGGKVRIRRDIFHDAFRKRYLIERGLAGRPDPELTQVYWKGGI